MSLYGPNIHYVDQIFTADTKSTSNTSLQRYAVSKSIVFTNLWEFLPVSAWVVSRYSRLPPVVQRHAVSGIRLTGNF